MWIYYNLFQPVLHLIEKAADGTRIRRKWDAAATPLARLLAIGALEPVDRECLEALYATTYPRALRRTIRADLHRLLYPRPSLIAPAESPPGAVAAPAPARRR